MPVERDEGLIDKRSALVACCRNVSQIGDAIELACDHSLAVRGPV